MSAVYNDYTSVPFVGPTYPHYGLASPFTPIGGVQGGLLYSCPNIPSNLCGAGYQDQNEYLNVEGASRLACAIDPTFHYPALQAAPLQQPVIITAPSAPFPVLQQAPTVTVVTPNVQVQAPTAEALPASPAEAPTVTTITLHDQTGQAATIPAAGGAAMQADDIQRWINDIRGRLSGRRDAIQSGRAVNPQIVTRSPHMRGAAQVVEKPWYKKPGTWFLLFFTATLLASSVYGWINRKQIQAKLSTVADTVKNITKAKKLTAVTQELNESAKLAASALLRRGGNVVKRAPLRRPKMRQQWY